MQSLVSISRFLVVEREWEWAPFAAPPPRRGGVTGDILFPQVALSFMFLVKYLPPRAIALQGRQRVLRMCSLFF